MHGGGLLAARLGKHSGRRNNIAHPIDAALFDDLAIFTPVSQEPMSVQDDLQEQMPCVNAKDMPRQHGSGQDDQGGV